MPLKKKKKLKDGLSREKAEGRPAKIRARMAKRLATRSEGKSEEQVARIKGRMDKRTQKKIAAGAGVKKVKDKEPKVEHTGYEKKMAGKFGRRLGSKLATKAANMKHAKVDVKQPKRIGSIKKTTVKPRGSAIRETLKKKKRFV